MYNRLFTKILDSSIWLEPSATRIVWVTLIAAMDQDGYAHFSAVENLACRARVTVEETEKALACFMSPDVNSANPEYDGRRIERVPGGFLVLNATEHRKVMSREIQREQTRLRVQRFREKQSEKNTSPVTRPLPDVTPASESASESRKGDARGKPDLAAARAYGAELGMAETEVDSWFDHFESNGWKVGGKTAMKDWKAALRNGKRHVQRSETGNGIKPRAVSFDERARRKGAIQEELNAGFRAAKKDSSGKAIYSVEEKAEREKLRKEMETL